MALFRCSICGENFPGSLLGEVLPIGFYTTRYVEAESPSEAEVMALDALRTEEIFKIPVEARTENARVYFEEIEEVPMDTKRKPNSGFSFFVMGT